jgi:DNA-binding PadR family transcriptional regulator
MARKAELGEFEHLVLLATLQLDDEAFAPDIAGVLERRAGREMSRGTLYAALERLEGRGLLTWEPEATTPGRSGKRRRRFEVTPAGREALAAYRKVLEDLWSGIGESLLGERP